MFVLGVVLPGYSSHRRVYEIIGLSAGYCTVIDRIVDEDPPLVRDVFPDVGSMEVLPRHFGYRDREFPYMAKFVLDRFGNEEAQDQAPLKRVHREISLIMG
jgi:hypothetical protein